MTELIEYTDQVVVIPAVPGITLKYNTNEYTDHLAGRIALTEETIKNYTFAIVHARTYAERASMQSEQRIAITLRTKLIELKAFIDDAMSKRNDDLNNYINRMCSIPGDTALRQWRIMFAMERDAKGWPQYLVRNVNDADRFMVVSMIQMTNLY